MHTNQSKDSARGNVKVPSHDPMPGVDDKPIDAGATNGAQLPEETQTGKPQRLSREAVERGVPADPDPDDPVSP